MKEFLKFTFATITGLIVTGILLTFICIITIFSLASASESETQVHKNSVMWLKLNGILTERSQPAPLGFLTGENYESYGLDDILASIQKAKKHENIKGIYLEAGDFKSGFASLEEIRTALADFKQSGKFIIAYADTYTQGLYYLSSVADKILLNPHGMLEWRGLASVPMFYKGLMDQLGIEMQIFKVGTYKSAVEPWTNSSMSEANRNQVNAYLSSIWDKLANDIAQSRNLTIEQLNDAANNMVMLRPADESLKRGLIDTLIYKTEVQDYLKMFANIDKDENMPLLDIQDMINIKKNAPKDKSGNIIAVYYANGEIDGVKLANETGIDSDEVIQDLRRLQENEDVKAVVLRVNSPGGSAYGSEQIWHALNKLKQEKPVIVSMSDYAASGGYYISCNADTIVAEPTTITGSIGIYGQVPNVKGLTDKLGITFDVVKTNPHADFGITTRPMNEKEKQLMQTYIEKGYELFITRCSEGRHINKTNMEQIAQGRVWSGIAAKELGLIDELGGLDKAIEIAATKAKIDNYTLINYPKKKNLWENMFNSNLGNYLRMRLLDDKMKEIYHQFNLWKNLNRQDIIQARMPFYLDVQ